MKAPSEVDEQGELRLQLLGGLNITLGGVAVRGFLSSKVQALLCYLAVSGRSHPRETLMTLLWGDMPEERAAHGLRQALSNLQKLLGPYLLVTRQTAAFNRTGPPYYLDVEDLLSLLKEAESAPFGVHRRLRDALQIYHGEFLDGFYVRDAGDFEEWVASQRERLRFMVLGALQKLAAHHSARGEYERAAGYLRELLRMEPWREDAHRQLMLLLAYLGQPDQAAAQYQACKQALLKEVGEEPAEETTRIYRAIRAGDVTAPEGLCAPGNLPPEHTPLIGRQTDLDRIEALLADPACRVLTLTGPGGIGKTRLALHIATTLAADFEHGAFFVPLAEARDAEAALDAIARVLGVEEAASRTMQSSLEAALRGKEMLLVLDNFEQLLSTSHLVGKIAAASPRLRVLVTSRARLRLRDERIYKVEPLALPGLQEPALPEVVSLSPAVRMFVERAQSARPGFAISDANALAVAEICHRLDGLPLAIELAAARLQIMPVQALLARLENRLALLAGGPRDLPARQRTLRATIDWSYNLLSTQERALFMSLSVFAGGCTLDAIEAIYAPVDEDSEGAVLESISTLADNHLVQQAEQAGGEVRFRLLEVIRQYALESLAAAGEESDARRRHAAHYLGLACAAQGHFMGPNQRTWLDRLEAEHDNLRAALRWALVSGEEGAVEMGLRACGAVWRFWERRGYISEGRRWLGEFAAAGEALDPALRAEALRAGCTLAFKQGNLQRAGELGQLGLLLYEQVGDKVGIAGALSSLGNVRREQGEHAVARALYERGLILFRELGDARAESAALNNLGATVQREGDLAHAQALYEQSLAIRRATGDAGGVAYTLDKLGEVTADLGDLDRAAALCEESLAIRRELGDKHGLALGLANLGTIETRRGNTPRAAELLENSLSLHTDLGEIWGIATALRGLGALAAEQGDHAEAARLYDESLRLYRENGDPYAVAQVLADLEAVRQSAVTGSK